MGSKRPRPWSRQPSGNSGSVAVAAATLALAALSLPEAGALSCSCLGRSDSSRTRRWGEHSDGATCTAGRRDGPHRRRKARLVVSSSGGGAGAGAGAGGGGACRARLSSRSSSNSGRVRSMLPPSPPAPAVLPLAGDREGGSEGNSSGGRSPRLREGSVSPSISAISVSHVLEPPPRTAAAPRPAGRVPTTPPTTPSPAAAASSGTRAARISESKRSTTTQKQGHRWKRDNDVRMFLMERGLSQWEVRKVLPVMRRDPELVNDVATLAARMQAIADLLEAAVSWYSPEGEATTGTGMPEQTAPGVAPLEAETAAPRTDHGAGSLPSALTSTTELGDGDPRSWHRIRNGQQQGEESASRRTVRAAPPAAAAWLTGGGDNSSNEDTVAERMAAMRLLGGIDDDCDLERKEHRATPNAAASAAASAEDTAPAAAAAAAAMERAEGGGEGPRLHAYQLVSSEPRLLLLRAEPDLAGRLRFLLDMLPGLRGGCWNGRLRRAAPLLAIDTGKLQGRLEGLVQMFPDHVDMQAVLNQAPLLLRHRTETVAAALANTERLIPGLRVDRILRSAPHVLVQPLDVVERRLSKLRKVLGLTPSPELEQMRIDIGPTETSGGGGGGTGRGGREGGRAAGVRTLARFANAFPQILAMEPHTVQAKIEGLEELLPGMDGLAVVSSRPHLLGFSVSRNVSLKVSGLRALMTWREGPEQHQRHQQASSAMAGDDLAAAVTRCPSLLTLSSETVARKVEELQEALPPGRDARAVVAKEPRVLALDTGSTVPRKLDGLTRALASHANGGGGEEAVAAAAAQVLRYYPNALRLDPATLAGKLEALRGAGLSSETVVLVVGGAPRCLSAAARTLEQRVSTLKEAFPSVCVDGMLRQAPGLLQNRIDPGARVKVLQELFPSLDPLRLVEGAPMLLALSERTLRAKSDAWRSVLEARVEQPWEQAIAEFPQLLCQGLGRAARVAFLLLPADSSSPSPSTTAAAVSAAIAPSTCASDDHGDAAGAAGAVAIAAGTRTMSAATACREVCRRVTDFESDHPGYPVFLDSVLLAARGQPAGGGVGVAAPGGGVRAVREQEGSSGSPNSSASLLSVERGMLLGGVTLSHADLESLAGHQVSQRPAGPTSATATAAGAGVPNGHARVEAPMRSGNNGQHRQQQQPLPGAPLASSAPVSTPLVEEVRLAVTSEKALGAAMTAAAKGPGGGREAAAMLVLEDVGVQRHAGRR